MLYVSLFWRVIHDLLSFVVEKKDILRENRACPLARFLEIFKILVNGATLYFAKRVNYLTKSQPIRPAFLFDECSNYFNTRSYLHEFNLACNIISQLERWRYRSGTSSHIDLLLANRWFFYAKTEPWGTSRAFDGACTSSVFSPLSLSLPPSLLPRFIHPHVPVFRIRGTLYRTHGRYIYPKWSALVPPYWFKLLIANFPSTNGVHV